MHKKALTVAIAGALAAPMAAQAVEVSISGHVNRALFITDSDSGTKRQGSGQRQLRLPLPVHRHRRDDGRPFGRREARVRCRQRRRRSGCRFAMPTSTSAGEFGKVSIGHGDQGGEGSVYNDKSGTTGIAHGHPGGDSDSRRLLRLARRRRSPQRSDPLRHPRVRPGLGGRVGRQRRRGLRRGHAEPGTSAAPRSARASGPSCIPGLRGQSTRSAGRRASSLLPASPSRVPGALAATWPAQPERPR